MRLDPARLDLLDMIALTEAINQLSPIQREIITLYYWHGLTYDEIGAELGPKFRGKVLTGNAIRFYQKKALKILLPLLRTN